MEKKKIVSLAAVIALTGSISLYGGDEGLVYPHTVKYGLNAGRINTGPYNVFIGVDNAYDNTSGTHNTFVGYRSGRWNSTGNSNTYSGSHSGFNNTTGDYNTFSGNSSGYSNTIGSYNTFSGSSSGTNNTTGSYNTFSGNSSGLLNTTGSSNTFIGYASGHNADINGSVLLGHKAGYFATRDNTLYISNSDTNDSLIYGEFDTGVVKINGDLNTTGFITTDLVVNNPRIGEAALALSRENSGGHSDVGFTLENKTDGGGFKWAFQTAFQAEGFSANKIGTGGYEFSVANPTDDFNNVELAAAGKVFFTGGHLVNPSSRAYKDDIKTLDTKTARAG